MHKNFNISPLLPVYLSVVDVGVKDKVSGRVAQSKVVLGQLGLAAVKSQLVTQEPALKKNKVNLIKILRKGD